MSIKYLTRIAILSALCVVLRFAFASLPNVQPITAIFLVSAVFFGLGDAILIMSITMLVTAFLLGLTPVIFWQILSFSIIILLWRFIIYPMTSVIAFDTINNKYPKILTLVQALCVGLLSFLYGVQIDAVYAYIYNMPFWTYIGAGFTFNLAHAISTAIFYPIIYMIFENLMSRRNENNKF